MRRIETWMGEWMCPEVKRAMIWVELGANPIQLMPIIMFLIRIPITSNTAKIRTSYQRCRI